MHGPGHVDRLPDHHQSPADHDTAAGHDDAGNDTTAHGAPDQCPSALTGGQESG